MALTFEPELLEQAIELRERVAGAANPFNAFRAALKDIKKVQAGEASELWRAAGLAIQQKQSVAAMAGPTQSPSAETQDGQGPQEPVEEEYDPEEEEAEADVPGESSKPPGLEEAECYPLADTKLNHLYPYDDIETFEEFEERVAQGCALSLPVEREEVEAYAMELIGNALVYLDCSKRSLQPAQIRLQLKTMRLNVRETAVGLASRFCSLARALERIGGPGALDDG